MSNRFDPDNLAEFADFYQVSKEDLRTLCSWIDAPANLQQFKVAAQNLQALFNVQLEPELATELGLNNLPIAQWKFLLDKIYLNSNDLPETLACTAPSPHLPRGMIELHPVYATLLTSPETYPKPDEGKIRFIHLIGMTAAITYRGLFKAGVIQEENTGFTKGLREIRALANPAKRPKNSLPDWQKAVCLDEIAQIQSAWFIENQHPSWGDGLRLLLTSTIAQTSRIVRSAPERRADQLEIVSNEKPSGQNINISSEFDSSLGTSNEESTGLTVELIYRTVDDKTANQLQRHGLHRSEMDSRSAVFISDEDAPITVRSNEALFRRRNLPRVRNALTRKAQGLPNDTKNPIPYEVHALMHSAQQDLKDPRLFSLALIVLLMVYSGRSIEELASLIIINTRADFAIKKPKGMAYIIDREIFSLPVIIAVSPAKFNQKTSSVLEGSYGHDKTKEQGVLGFSIPLPLSIKACLDEFIFCRIKQNTRIERPSLFTQNIGQLKHNLTDYLKQTNLKFSTSWTENKLSRLMPMAIMECTQDPALVQLITGQKNGHSEVASYYQRTSVHYAQNILKNAHSWLIEWSTTGFSSVPTHSQSYALDSHHCIGSELALPHNYIKDLCQDLKGKARAAMRIGAGDQQLINAHNTLVAYIATWLGLITGYRAVTDPLSDLGHLDKQSRLLLISDKDDGLYQHTRLVPVTPRFLEQLERYSWHLYQVANRLAGSPKLQQEIFDLAAKYHGRYDSATPASIPFFFLLSDTLRATTVSPRSLSNFLPNLNIRPNSNRHYLRSRLVELGAPGELIAYFMGHWESGEQPHQKCSSIDPITIALEIKPYIEQLEKQAGWTVLRGLAID